MARSKLPFQSQDCGHSRSSQGAHAQSGALARNDGSSRRRFDQHPLIERRQGARFHGLTRGQISRAHLDAIGTEQAGDEGGFPIINSSGQNKFTVPRQDWLATFEVQNHLRQRECGMLSHMAAGFITLADHISNSRFQGEFQQGIIRGDIHDGDAALQQFSDG